MPQETKSIDPSKATAAPSLRGLVVTCEDEQALVQALSDAFDYRGDVTLTLDDNEEISGYVFDRARGESLSESYVRLMPTDSDDKVVVAFSRIARVSFSERDPAAGKSFETWVKKYTEKKLAGQDASIYTDQNNQPGSS